MALRNLTVAVSLLGASEAAGSAASGAALPSLAFFASSFAFLASSFACYATVASSQQCVARGKHKIR